MEFKFTYLPLFDKTLEKLPKKHQKQILKKIQAIQIIKDQTIFQHIKPLAFSIEAATHKLKAGNYRIFFKVEGNVFEVQYVEIRSKAYKKK